MSQTRIASSPIDPAASKNEANTDIELSHSSNQTNKLAENLAFVVNIPIALSCNTSKVSFDFRKTINEIWQIQDAYLKGHASETCPPFKMVFCVNCNNAQKELLDAFKQQWDNATEKVKQISIMTYAWEGDEFPYGEIRNALLHSKETQDEIKAFQEAGFYPYVSIGDADPGERLVEVDSQVKHIFAAIQQRLNRRMDSPLSSNRSIHLSSSSEPSSDDEPDRNTEGSNNTMSISAKWGEFSDSGNAPTRDLRIRPYLIAGGYRPYATEADHGKRTESIQLDMNIREQLAKTVNPLGPYFPEPNLFIDGHIADKVNFGEKSAEFNDLRESVSKFIVRDMLSNKPTNTSDEEWKERVQVDIQNNRHPDRNMAIATFFNLAIATSTDRLFKKIGEMEEEINSNKVAQHHQHPNNAKPAYLLSRYDGKRNGGPIFTNIRDFLAKEENKNNMSKVMALYHELMYRQKKEDPGYKADPLDQSYEQHKTKDNEILKLVKDLINESKKITQFDKNGQSNRSAAELATLKYTALDILNTAIATVYGKSINTLLKEHWENELKYFSQAYQQSNSATTSNQQNRQLNTSSVLIDPGEGVDMPSQAKNTKAIRGETTWKTFSQLVNKEVDDPKSTSTSEFIYKCNPGNHRI